MNFTEVSRVATIIDEDIIGFDVYDAVRTSGHRQFGLETGLSGHNHVREVRLTL